MLDAANEALTFIQGRIRADLDNDRMLVLSLVREFEIIGEAPAKYPPTPVLKTPRFRGKILPACAID
jgi:uncharacterized protein with HEPN domain